MFTYFTVTFVQPNIRSNENLLMFGVMFIWMAAIMIAIPSAKLYDTYSFPEEPEKEFCHPGTWFILIQRLFRNKINRFNKLVSQSLDRDLTIAKTIITFFLPLTIIFFAYVGEFYTKW